jgi:hypothetical protein
MGKFITDITIKAPDTNRRREGWSLGVCLV